MGNDKEFHELLAISSTKPTQKILPLAEQACFDQRKEESVMVEKVSGNRGVGSPVKSS